MGTEPLNHKGTKKNGSRQREMKCGVVGGDWEATMTITSESDNDSTPVTSHGKWSSGDDKKWEGERKRRKS